MKFKNKYVVVRESGFHRFEAGTVVKLEIEESDYIHRYKTKDKWQWIEQTDVLPLEVVWNEGIRILSGQRRERFTPKMGKNYYLVSGVSEDQIGSKVHRHREEDTEPWVLINENGDHWAKFSDRMVTKKEIIAAGAKAFEGTMEVKYDFTKPVDIYVRSENPEFAHLVRKQLGDDERAFATFNIGLKRYIGLYKSTDIALALTSLDKTLFDQNSIVVRVH